MELSKNSKWLKFYLNFNSYKPTNMCDYFWGSIKSIVISLLVLTAVTLILITLLSPILLFWYDYDINSTFGTFQGIGLMTWFCLILGFILYKILNYKSNKPYVYKEKKDSLFKIWYKDFKNKHCTMITWKD